MKITAVNTGWAKQNPADWWQNLKFAHKSVMKISGIKAAFSSLEKVTVIEPDNTHKEQYRDIYLKWKNLIK